MLGADELRPVAVLTDIADGVRRAFAGTPGAGATRPATPEIAALARS